MTAACETWAADDFLTRAGFMVRPTRDGRRTASRGPLTYVLDGQCRHDPADCPPHRPVEHLEVAA